MKRRVLLIISILLLPVTGLYAGEKIEQQNTLYSKIKELNIYGKVTDENASFQLNITLSAQKKTRVKLVSGAVSELKSETENLGTSFFFSLPKPKIVFERGAYYALLPEKGDYRVSFDFSARVEQEKRNKRCSFSLLSATSRNLQVEFDSADVELKIADALNLVKSESQGKKDGKTLFTAVLPPEGDFSATWKRHIDKIKSKLVTTADAKIVSSVLPGTVKVSASFRYKVIQGKLSELRVRTSKELNILSVNGQNIQDWKIVKGGQFNTLHIKLSREYEDSYFLRLESEKILPDFPCKFTLPVVNPSDVLSLDGYLLFGTGKSVKLIIEEVSGMNQVENVRIPEIMDRSVSPVDDLHKTVRSRYTYKFSGDKYRLVVSAENITPSYSAELNYVMDFRDENLLLKADFALDIKDAPLRELAIRYDPSLTVSRVSGKDVIADDYELSSDTHSLQKQIKIPLKAGTMGRTNITIYFEKSMKGLTLTAIPPLFLKDAKSLRGYILLTAGKGLLLSARELKHLKMVHTGSVPIREKGLQLAYRIKGRQWSGIVEVKHEKASLVSEVFHISSIGDGTIYGSSIFSYHISGAPIGKLRYTVDASLKNLEFIGRGIVDWKEVGTRDGGMKLWELNFREKILGDFSVLATYELSLEPEAREYKFGAVSTTNTESESGFTVISSLRNIKVSGDGQLPPSIQEIEQSDLPEEYRGMVNNPVLKAYRCVRNIVPVEVTVGSYKSEKLLDIVVDHSEITTTIDRNGEAETVALYRIKNFSHQFLTLTLPVGSKLWKVDVDGKRVVAANGSDGLLIPLPRHQDVNVPISISVNYAERLGKLNSDQQIELKAPKLNIGAMFTKWNIKVPHEYTFMQYDGNMTTDFTSAVSGIEGMFRRIMMGAFDLSFAGLLIPWAVISFAVMLVALSWGSGKLRIIATVVGFIILALGCLGTFAMLASFNLRLLPSTLYDVVFTKIFSQPGELLFINADIENMDATSLSKTLYAVLLLLFSIVPLFFSYKVKSRIWKAILRSFTATFILASGGLWLHFNALAAFFLVAIVPLSFTVGVSILIFRRARQKSMLVALLFALLMPFGVLDVDASMSSSIESVLFDMQIAEKGIRVHADYIVESSGDAQAQVDILMSPAVITGKLPDNSGIEIVRSGNKYVLKTASAGVYKFAIDFLLPYSKKNGITNFSCRIPVCRKNLVTLKTDIENVKIISPDAVFFETANNSAKASFIPGETARFTLKPQVRDVEREKVRFFANIDGRARFSSGFIEMAYSVNLRIAQGESSSFALKIPSNMRVTAVKAPDLGTWSYDEKKSLLEILLSQPHHGDFRMDITCQIVNLNLPYSARLGCLDVQDAVRQHGSIGILTKPSIRVQIGNNAGFSRINNSDFPYHAHRKDSIDRFIPKKAFRYFESSALLEVSALAVEPEIRVTESCNINFEEERTSIVSKLALDISKSGIFSVSIALPKGFEIDKLSGKEIQHWDEVQTPERKVIVNFRRRILGKTSLLIELSRIGKADSTQIKIPRITVAEAKRLTGNLNVRVEHGTRLEILKRQGIDMKTGLFRKGISSTLHRFTIHRPDWFLEAKLNIATPWVQVEALQTAKIDRGAIECKAFFKYKIENAAVKHFRLKLPDGAEAPEFTGRDIAGALNIEGNIWEIELYKKVIKDYRLQVSFRLSSYEKKSFTLFPVTAENTELQTGYIALFSEGTEQLELLEKYGEINSFDPRRIPPYFKAGELSNAVMCFRTVGADYKIEVGVAKLKAAEVLKASIEKLDMTSTVSDSGMLLTKLNISLINGNETFFRMQLPSKSSVWSVLIDEQPVEVAREAQALLIPLKQSFSGNKKQTIELLYSILATTETFKDLQTYSAPSFDLPLRNVNWTLFLPSNFTYDSFGGSMDYSNRFMDYICSQDRSIKRYDEANKEIFIKNRSRAKSLLLRGIRLSKEGNQMEANDAYRNAMNLSNDDSLKEDIQGQWLASSRQEGVKAIAQRRNKKASQLQQGKLQQDLLIPQTDFNDMASIKQQLGSAELKSLQAISDKIFMQQRAATVTPAPLTITIPDGGVKLQFKRGLQVKKNIPLTISFDVTKNYFEWSKLHTVLAFVAISAIFATLFMLFGVATKTQQAT